MKMLSGIIFFSIAIVLAESRNIQHSPNEISTNCMISYLKNVNALESSYPEFPVEKDEQECETFMSKILGRMKEKEVLSVDVFSNSSNVKECIREKTKAKNFIEQFLKSGVYLLSDSLLPEDQLTKLKEEASKSGTNLMKVFVTSCISNETYVKTEKLFDEVYEFAANTEKKNDAISDYCTRKFVTDNKLINLTKYDLPLNPANLDIEGVDCDDNIKKILEALEKIKPRFLGQSSESDSDEIKCNFKLFDEIKFTQKMIGIFTLAKLVINDEQKGIEREHFAEEVNNAVYVKCIELDGIL